MPSFPKVKTWRSEKWLRAVAELTCVLCEREGMTQAAHRNYGKSMGMKTDDCWTAALCVACHADLDSGKDLDREQRRSVMDAAILDTLVELVRAGKVKVA